MVMSPYGPDGRMTMPPVNGSLSYGGQTFNNLDDFHAWSDTQGSPAGNPWEVQFGNLFGSQQGNYRPDQWSNAQTFFKDAYFNNPHTAEGMTRDYLGGLSNPRFKTAGPVDNGNPNLNASGPPSWQNMSLHEWDSGGWRQFSHMTPEQRVNIRSQIAGNSPVPPAGNATGPVVTNPTYNQLPANTSNTGPVTQGTDPIGNSAATGDAPPEWDGDVYDYAPPENNLLPQLEGQYQTILDMLRDPSTAPGMSPVNEALELEKRLAQDAVNQSLAVRGIGDSTIANSERDLSRIRNNASAEQRRQQYLQNEVNTRLAPLAQIYAQGSDARDQSLNEFMQFFDRQYRSDTRDDQYAADAMRMMLQALGLTSTPVSSSFFTPNPSGPIV